MRRDDAIRTAVGAGGRGVDLDVIGGMSVNGEEVPPCIPQWAVAPLPFALLQFAEVASHAHEEDIEPVEETTTRYIHAASSMMCSTLTVLPASA